MADTQRTSDYQWRRSMIVAQNMRAMTVKDKRHIFTALRSQGATEHTFVPKFGVTIGEFAAFQIVHNEK